MYIKHFPGHVKLYDIGQGWSFDLCTAYKYMYIMGGYINTLPSISQNAYTNILSKHPRIGDPQKFFHIQNIEKFHNVVVIPLSRFLGYFVLLYSYGSIYMQYTYSIVCMENEIK